MHEQQTSQISVGPEQWGLFMPRAPLLTSDNLHWNNLAARRYHHVPARISAPALDHHLVTFYLRGSGRVDMRLNDAFQRGAICPGKLLIMNAGQENQWEWDGSPDVLHAYLSPEYMSSLALEIGVYDFELIDGVEVDDPILFDLGKQIVVELENPQFGDDLVGDALAQMIGIRLIRAHSSRTGQKIDKTASLPAWRLKKVFDAIEERLEVGVSLEELAAVVGLSKFHFARSFKSATGMPPHRFILGRRLQRAKDMLGNAEISIAEIALSSGFASQEHLTTCFRKQLGTTPAQYRRSLLS